MAKTSAPRAAGHVVMALLLLLLTMSTKDTLLVAAPRHRPVEGRCGCLCCCWGFIVIVLIEIARHLL